MITIGQVLDDCGAPVEVGVHNGCLVLGDEWIPPDQAVALVAFVHEALEVIAAGVSTGSLGD